MFHREGWVSDYNADEIGRLRVPGCTCSDKQLELVGCDCMSEPALRYEGEVAAAMRDHGLDRQAAEAKVDADRYAEYLACGGGEDPEPACEYYSDPEAQADLELHDFLHPFGYGIERSEVDELAAWFVSTVGYDPFADDPEATIENVRRIRDEYLAAAGET